MTAPTMPRTLAVGADAITRLDYGHGLPGDEITAAVYEAECQQSAYVYDREMERVQWDAYLAGKCLYCGPTGSYGPDCGDCPLPEPAVAIQFAEAA